MHGPRDALAYGVKVTRRHRVPRRRRRRHRRHRSTRPWCPSPTTTRSTSLHERIKVAERDLLVATTHALATRPWRVVDRKVHWDPMTAPTDARSAEDAVVRVRRALVSVYDKTGLVELATGLVEAGVEIVSTGLDRQDHRRRRACP